MAGAQDNYDSHGSLSDHKIEGLTQALKMASMKSSREGSPTDDPVPFGDEMGSEVVTLVVGPDEYKFRVHKKPLCKKIAYFAKMFDGQFEEASTGVATFPEDDAVEFGKILSWVYRDTIPEIAFLKNADGKWRESWDVVKLYALAEKFCITEVMDRTLEAYMEAQRVENVLPGIEDIDKGYSETGEGSSFRKFFCRSFVFTLTKFEGGRADGAWNNKGMQMLLVKHPDLARDIVPILRKTMGSVTMQPLHPLKAPKCEFHSHGAFEPCFLEREN